jgi:hypothetical protein
VRAQVVTPRKSRRVSRPLSRTRSNFDWQKAYKIAALLSKPAAVLFVLLMLFVGYRVLAGSKIFELKRIEVSDVQPDLRAQIEQITRKAAGETRLLDIDLEQIRDRIEDIKRVRSASVARVLPDGLSIQVEERKPAVLVRRSSDSIVWLDEDGVELGDISDIKPPSSNDNHIPPIAKGFSEGNRSSGLIAEDRQRMELYREIERAFSHGTNPVWNLVDEIDLTFIRNITIRLIKSSVTVAVGSTDFRNRFDTALQVLGAIKRGDVDALNSFRVQDPQRLIDNADSINYIHAERPDRIVLAFSAPTKEKPAQDSEPVLSQSRNKSDRQSAPNKPTGKDKSKKKE